MASGPRRIVSDVLLVSAFAVSNAIEIFVLMKANDITTDSSEWTSSVSNDVISKWPPRF